MGKDSSRDGLLGNAYYTGRKDVEKPSGTPSTPPATAKVPILSRSLCSRYAVGLALALATMVFSLRGISYMLLPRDEMRVLYSPRASEIEDPPPRIGHARGANSVEQTQVKTLQAEVKYVGNDTDSTPWAWENAGGKYGLSCDWWEAVSIPGMDSRPATIRSEKCATNEKQEQVRKILDKRRRAPADGRVAVCVRTKDFGRFLPEWLAFHYAVGVDEFMVYDDDSVDGTREVLEPFIRAGLVVHNKVKIDRYRDEMKPLNACLSYFLSRKERDCHAPRWLLFHDVDEYMFPGNKSQAIFDSLRPFDAHCCLQVKRIQYGSAGYRETPRGLTLENFLTHAKSGAWTSNRFPKIALNIDPTSPELGIIRPPLRSMHHVKGAPGGCNCEVGLRSTIRINHYLGSVGDFVDKTRRYWQAYTRVDKLEEYMQNRDANDVESDEIIHWACATREILARAAEGLDLATGEPFPAARSSNT